MVLACWLRQCQLQNEDSKQEYTAAPYMARENGEFGRISNDVLIEDGGAKSQGYKEVIAAVLCQCEQERKNEHAQFRRVKTKAQALTLGSLLRRCKRDNEEDV